MRNPTLDRFAQIKVILALVIFALGLTLATIASTLAASAPNMSDAQIREEIQNVLSQLHPTDTADWWRGLGPRAPGIMVGMYEQESFVYHRLRLVQALAWFDDPSATAFLEKQAQDSADDVIRNGAIQSLGTSQGAKEEDFIAGFLDVTDPHTRLAAAQALKKIGDARAQVELTAFYSNEKVQWVKDQASRGPLAPAPIRMVQTPVGTLAQNTISLDFAGSWKGTLLVPVFEADKGTQAYPVTLDLTFDSAKNLQGTLSIQAGLTGVITHFDHASGDARRFKAEIHWKDLKAITRGRAGDESSPLILDVEMFPHSASVRVLHASLALMSSEMMLRRQP